MQSCTYSWKLKEMGIYNPFPHPRSCKEIYSTL
ncbi:unnamed protein product [Linum tenue]|uniref:Uncharacterized protein n=1 Tax=Linum tenue TaxID=586396 RepID=A0AAV0Q7K2_9ROSI|nr:unnamed protein product [Linum tenue]